MRGGEEERLKNVYRFFESISDVNNKRNIMRPFLLNLEETRNLDRRWARNESRADNVISKNYH